MADPTCTVRFGAAIPTPTDVVLHVTSPEEGFPGYDIHCHAVSLSLHSSVLRDLLRSTSPGEGPTVVPMAMDTWEHWAAMIKLVGCMYPNASNTILADIERDGKSQEDTTLLNPFNAISVLELADKYGVCSAALLCRDYIMLSPERAPCGLKLELTGVHNTVDAEGTALALVAVSGHAQRLDQRMVVAWTPSGHMAVELRTADNNGYTCRMNCKPGTLLGALPFLVRIANVATRLHFTDLVSACVRVLAAVFASKDARMTKEQVVGVMADAIGPWRDTLFGDVALLAQR